ncbi:hypothetical protein IG631_06756 [Alternaria alternata]|nr:hypothetical protein IG631_06756 [Alternaria alternata]
MRLLELVVGYDYGSSPASACAAACQRCQVRKFRWWWTHQSRQTIALPQVRAKGSMQVEPACRRHKIDRGSLLVAVIARTSSHGVAKR